MKKSNYILPSLCLLLSTQAVFAEKHEMEQHGSHEHGVARLTVATTDSGLELSLESPAANLFGFEHKANTSEERKLVHDAVEKLNAGSNIFSMNSSAACTFDSAVIKTTMTEEHKDEKHGDEKHDHDDHKDEKHADEKHEHDDHKDEKHADEKHDHDDHKDEKHADEKHEHDDHKDEKHADEKHEHDDHKDEKHADEKHEHDDHKDEKHADEKHEHDDHKDEKHADKKHDHGDHKGEKHDDHEEESHSDVDVTWTFNCKNPTDVNSVSTKLFSAFPNGFEELDVEWITASSSGKTELEKDGTITLKQ